MGQACHMSYFTEHSQVTEIEMIFFHFAVEEMEVQRSEVTCPKDVQLT